MKKANITFLLIVLFCMTSTYSFAHDIEVENSDGVMLYYNWIKNNTELEVTYSSDSKKYTGDLAIPESAEYNGISYPVTSIGSSAFSVCKELHSLEIPRTITKIGKDAFYYTISLNKIIVKDIAAWCENADNYESNPISNAHQLYKDKNTRIVDLVIPEGVNKIGRSAFSGCYSLHSVRFSSSGIEIGNYAFSGCIDLYTIHNAENITLVGGGAFNNTAWYNSQPNGLIYIGKSAYQYKGEMPQNTSIVIKEGTLHITYMAFRNCHNLSAITIPSSLISIGDYAFSGCTGLSSITFPNSIIKIGEYAFYECKKITSISIPNSVTSIGSCCFAGCSNLSSVSLPNSITDIASSIFWKCVSLTNIAIPEGVTSIGNGCFAECSNLINVEIPNSVTNIGGGAFSGCTLLQNINIPNSVESIGEGAFSETAWYKKKYEEQPKGQIYAGKVVYAYKGKMPEGTNLIIEDGTLGIAGGAFRNMYAVYQDEDGKYKEDEEESYKFNNLISVSIPKSVTNIGSSAFDGCIGLESIILPSGLKEIGPSAFFNCENLKSITLPYSLTTIFPGAFEGCPSLVEIKSFIESPFPLYDKIDINDYGINTFSPETYANAKLFVPEGTAGLYSSTNGWNRFNTIEEFTPPTYTLSYILDGKAYKSLQLREGQSIVPEPVPEKEGYSFSGWEGLPEVMPDHDVTATGTMTINNYKLTYLLDGELYTSMDIEYGAVITPEPDLFKEGCTFSGWIGLPETMPAHDVTVTGTFTPNKYKLIYLVDGTEYKSYEVEYMTPIIPEPAPTKVGHTFSGWVGLPETMPAHDVTVIGTFSINTYTLTYLVDGEEYASYEKQYGASITPEPAPVKEGYNFSGWSAIPEKMPAHDVTVTGNFIPNKYKLIYVVDGEEYKSYEVEFKAAIIPEPVPTKDGYSFSGWEGLPETMPAHDVTVTGSFIINTYKLTYIVDGEEYASYEIEYGSSITPEPAPIKEGYTFSGWSAIPATMPARDVTVMGSFTINTYKLTYTIDGEEYASYEIEYGSSITPEPAPIKEGYTFSGWSAIPATMPARDVTVTGSFSINIYLLTYMIDDTVYKTVKYEYGATITPEPAPEGDYATFKWVDLPETMPAHDVTVYASYETSIADLVELAQMGVIRIFTPNGKQIARPQKGLNIVVMQNGAVKKVVVK